MANKASYRDWLRQDLTELINALDISDLQKHFLRSRWLDQVIWTEKRADRNRNRYYILRLTAIIGAITIPALVSLNVSGEIASTIRWITFGLSLLVAISSAVEELFRYGERWRLYRRTAEHLKMEGWFYFQISGPYRRFSDHSAAYSAFAARAESIIQQDVEMYVDEIIHDKDTRERSRKEKNAIEKHIDESASE